MSLFSRLFKPRSKASAESSYKWQNEELGLYFVAKPEDRAWRAFTPAVADLVQRGFLEIYGRANLERFESTNSLPPEVIELIAEISTEIAEPSQTNPAFIILVTHQYVDADKLKRQIWRSRWVALMVARDTCAPPPESYVSYITSTYFSNTGEGVQP